MKRQEYVFIVINQLCKKYDLNLRDMSLPSIKKKISKKDWDRLTYVVKFGKEIH